MATMTQILQISLAVLGESQRKIGEKNSPTSFTVNGQVWDSGNFTIADNFGQKTVWQSANGVLTSFSWLIFTTNADVYLEFANTTPATDERAIVFVPANTYLVIPSSWMGGYANNTSRLDGAALVLDTDYGLINEIRVQRNAADLVGDATCRLVLIN